MDKFLGIAKRQVRNHNFNSNLASYHCAVIVSGGKVLSIGFNDFGSTKLQESKKHRHCNSVHAEVRALLQLKNREDARGSRIYVARINKNGQYAISAPCDVCSEILTEMGVKSATFTIDDDNRKIGKMTF
jgi:deoxycytidylate deaminase